MFGWVAAAAALGGGALGLNRLADLREAAIEAEYPPLGELNDVRGRHIHALVRGAGPDLVLIQGAGGNLRDWAMDLIPELSKHFRVIAFDRPGLGWSDRAPGYRLHPFMTPGETPQVQARILQEAADKIGVKNPVVAGHSFGGAVALAWGLEQPEDTAALAIIAGASNPWPGGVAASYQLFGTALGGIIVPFVTAFASDTRINETLHGIFAPQPRPQTYARRLGAGLTLRRPVLRTNARQVLALKSALRQMVEGYGTLPMPVEILHGRADTVVPFDIHAARLVHQIPGAELTALEGQGHMPHHTAPDAVIEAIRTAAARAGLH